VSAGLALDLLLSLAALPCAAAAGYLAVLTACSRRGRPLPPAGSLLRFAVVVPAHDEERGIAGTIRSLAELDYPRDRFQLVVVADNCADRTADVARGAGAVVLERRDAERRGKGYALRWAFDRLLRDSGIEAIVVVDADTVVSRNLLSAFAARFSGGEQALQAHYAVRNPEESWRTRLIAVAFAAIHGVRSRGREALHLSCGLRGNGMAFTAEVLRRVPHAAWSVVEDLEYGIQLGLAGVRVGYVEEAEVRGLMAAGEQASRSQRRRWEDGRRLIARTQAKGLLVRALRERSPVLLDLALDLLVPPLATIVTWSFAGLAACAVAAALGLGAPAAAWLYGLSLAAVAAYVLRAWALSGAGARGLLDLALAPVYVAWKLLLKFLPSHQRAGEWVRTRRTGEE
jgi:cellulose synthase/poly-beta-1,6-N-acetylglucosamine synthase-like glycosyltransferase